METLLSDRRYCDPLPQTLSGIHWTIVTQSRPRHADERSQYSLLGEALAEVEHGLLQLLLADRAVVVVVEHPEGHLHVVHLVAAVSQQLDGDAYDRARNEPSAGPHAKRALTHTVGPWFWNFAEGSFQALAYELLSRH